MEADCEGKMMDISRRKFLLLGLGTLTVGCASNTLIPLNRELGVVAPIRRKKRIAPVATVSNYDVIPRSAWTKTTVDRGKARPMNGVKLITIHHEGSNDSAVICSRSAVAGRLEYVRRIHKGKHWADIGYHYIIDGAGRVWSARPLFFQGAHVRNHNAHNIGIMVLGNFNRQYPSEAQLKRLPALVGSLRRKHNVSPWNIRGHREWVATACPGEHLHPKVLYMRSNGLFI